MTDNPYVWVAIVLALIIIASLSYYAGSLLFKVRHQSLEREKRRNGRIDDIMFSVHTIARATLQQQCELSEASIRLCHLLDALPLKYEQDFSLSYPSLYQLFDKIKHMPTHEARKALTPKERMRQDIQRGELEAELETPILKELEVLASLKVE